MWQEDPRRLGPTLGWAAQMARCAMDARVSRYDVTPVQTHVLMYLHQHGGQAPQRELTEFLRAKPSTVNAQRQRPGRPAAAHHPDGQGGGAAGPVCRELSGQ